MPFGVSFLEPAQVARALTPKTPVVICENDCVIVTGTSLLNAFDRLEVAEFTARSILASPAIGDIVHISDQEIRDIQVAFRLDL